MLCRVLFLTLLVLTHGHPSGNETRSIGIPSRVIKLQERLLLDLEERINPKLVLGAMFGFPLGFAIGTSTVGASGGDVVGGPSTLMGFGLAGAASGFTAASKFGRTIDARNIDELKPEDSIAAVRRFDFKVPREEFFTTGAVMGAIMGSIGMMLGGFSEPETTSLGDASTPSTGSSNAFGAPEATPAEVIKSTERQPEEPVEGPSGLVTKIPLVQFMVVGALTGGAIGSMEDMVNKLAAEAVANKRWLIAKGQTGGKKPPNLLKQLDLPKIELQS